LQKFADCLAARYKNLLVRWGIMRAVKGSFLKKEKGFSLVEVIVAASIISVFLVSLIGAYNLFLTLSLSNVHKVKATFLAEEGVEAVKILRDSSWATSIFPLASGTPYYLEFTPSLWSVTTTPFLVDSLYDRRVFFEDVYRDGAGDIVDSGGTFDSGTKKVTVTVEWQERGATSNKVIPTYITNLFDN